jgi:hypothetical protein
LAVTFQVAAWVVERLATTRFRFRASEPRVPTRREQIAALPEESRTAVLSSEFVQLPGAAQRWPAQYRGAVIYLGAIRDGFTHSQAKELALHFRLPTRIPAPRLPGRQLPAPTATLPGAGVPFSRDPGSARDSGLSLPEAMEVELWPGF